MSNVVSLTGVVMVRPLIEITTGTVAINRKTELASVAGELPPTDIVSDGRKRILSAKRLAPLFNARRAVERLLEREGAEFLGARLVPQSRLQEVETRLQGIEADFNNALDSLVDDLDVAYQEWEDAHPQWAWLIRSNRMTPTELRKRCRFRVVYFKPAPPDVDVGDRGVSTAEAVPAVLQDAANEAERLLTQFCVGKEGVTQKVLTAAVRMLDKLHSFSMLDPRIAPSLTGFRSVLETLPRAGKIGGRDFATLTAMLRMVADPHGMLEHGEKLFSNAKAGQPMLDLALESDGDETTEQPEPVTAEVEAFQVELIDEAEAPDSPQPLPTPPAPAASQWAALI